MSGGEIRFPERFRLETLRKEHPRRKFDSGQSRVDDWISGPGAPASGQTSLRDPRLARRLGIARRIFHAGHGPG